MEGDDESLVHRIRDPGDIILVNIPAASSCINPGEIVLRRVAAVDGVAVDAGRRIGATRVTQNRCHVSARPTLGYARCMGPAVKIVVVDIDIRAARSAIEISHPLSRVAANEEAGELNPRYGYIGD